jgi:hypothetical protein
MDRGLSAAHPPKPAVKPQGDSSQFTRQHLVGSLYELVELDTRRLVERLRSASQKFESLRVPAIAAAGKSSSTLAKEWSVVDILAHIAVLSKYYGVLTYEVGTGKTRRVDLLANIRIRDELGARMAKRPAAELIDAAIADHARTLRYLEQATPADMRNRAVMPGVGSMSAEEICRLSLCTHLEEHNAQLEAAIAARP